MKAFRTTLALHCRRKITFICHEKKPFIFFLHRISQPLIRNPKSPTCSTTSSSSPFSTSKPTDPNINPRFPQFPNHLPNPHSSTPFMARKRSRSERERDKIASRRCVTNRYIDVPTLERIGLHDQVVEILHSCGWTGLLEMRDVTYPDLVREFISEFEFLDEDEDQEGMFRFKVRNLEIEMTLGDVRELFGWPAEGQAGTPPLEDAVLAWKEITGGEVAFDPGRTVESGMRRELYCYLHRVISCTIYGRENGQEKVSQIDHDLLYYLHRRVPVDFARLLGSRLQEIRYMDGPLMCGGFVTRIVSSIAGFDIERNYRGRLELKLIDMGMLTRMRVIQVDEVTDTVAWIHFKEPTVSPPAPPIEHQQITPSEAVDLQNAFEQSSLAIKELSRDLNQMKKKLKSDMYRMEMNMYDLFQTVSPGWKPPFPPSPPSPVQEEYGVADTGEYQV